MHSSSPSPHNSSPNRKRRRKHAQRRENLSNSLVTPTLKDRVAAAANRNQEASSGVTEQHVDTKDHTTHSTPSHTISHQERPSSELAQPLRYQSFPQRSLSAKLRSAKNKSNLQKSPSSSPQNRNRKYNRKHSSESRGGGRSTPSSRKSMVGAAVSPHFEAPMRVMSVSPTKFLNLTPASSQRPKSSNAASRSHSNTRTHTRTRSLQEDYEAFQRTLTEASVHVHGGTVVHYDSDVSPQHEKSLQGHSQREWDSERASSAMSNHSGGDFSLDGVSAFGRKRNGSPSLSIDTSSLSTVPNKSRIKRVLSVPTGVVTPTGGESQSSNKTFKKKKKKQTEVQEQEQQSMVSPGSPKQNSPKSIQSLTEAGPAAQTHAAETIASSPPPSPKEGEEEEDMLSPPQHLSKSPSSQTTMHIDSHTTHTSSIPRRKRPQSASTPKRKKQKKGSTSSSSARSSKKSASDSSKWNIEQSTETYNVRHNTDWLDKNIEQLKQLADEYITDYQLEIQEQSKQQIYSELDSIADQHHAQFIPDEDIVKQKASLMFLEIVTGFVPKPHVVRAIDHQWNTSIQRWQEGKPNQQHAQEESKTRIGSARRGSSARRKRTLATASNTKRPYSARVTPTPTPGGKTGSTPRPSTARPPAHRYSTSFVQNHPYSILTDTNQHLEGGSMPSSSTSPTTSRRRKSGSKSARVRPQVQGRLRSLESGPPPQRPKSAYQTGNKAKEPPLLAIRSIAGSFHHESPDLMNPLPPSNQKGSSEVSIKQLLKQYSLNNSSTTGTRNASVQRKSIQHESLFSRTKAQRNELRGIRGV